MIVPSRVHVSPRASRWETNRAGCGTSRCASCSLRVSSRSSSSCSFGSSRDRAAIRSRSKVSASLNWPRLMARLARASSKASLLAIDPDGVGTVWSGGRSVAVDGVALDHLGDNPPQGVGRDRLGEEIDRAQLHGLDRLGDAAVRSQDHDRDDVARGPQPAEQLHAVHPGHQEVEQDQVARRGRGWPAARGRPVPSLGLDHRVADRCQRGLSISRTFGSSSTIRMRFFESMFSVLPERLSSSVARRPAG